MRNQLFVVDVLGLLVGEPMITRLARWVAVLQDYPTKPRSVGVDQEIGWQRPDRSSVEPL
jgi:hypothetical protein